MLRIRLRRTGAKKQPKYRVVVADVRAPRDGAFVDSIGYYDPLTEPSTISINSERALHWISKGAQPSDVVDRLLRTAGILEGPGRVFPAKPEPVEEVTAPAKAAAPTAPVAAATPDPDATVMVEAGDPDATVLVESEADPDATVIAVAEDDGTSGDK